MKKNKRLFVLIISIFSILAVLLFLLLLVSIQKSKASKEILKVRTETVRRGRLIETVNAPGQIEPRTKVDISEGLAGS